MTTHKNRRAGAAIVAVAATVLSVAAATTASAAPSPRLPDADLFCGDMDPLNSSEWGGVPGSDTLWVFTGPLAGHYVILSDSHYFMPGYQAEPPDSYAGLAMLDTRTWGAKKGLTDVVSCDFVSRWGEDGAPDTVSIVGPITMARVGR